MTPALPARTGPVDGYFSVRRVEGGGELVGGIYLVMQSDSAYPGTVVVSGSFTEPAPY